MFRGQAPDFLLRRLKVFQYGWRKARGSDQAEPAGALYGGELAVDLELAHGIGNVKVDGALAAQKKHSGFARGFALEGQTQAFQFTRAERASHCGQRAFEQWPDVQCRPGQLRCLAPVMPLARAEKVALESAPDRQGKRYADNALVAMRQPEPAPSAGIFKG